MLTMAIDVRPYFRQRFIHSGIVIEQVTVFMGVPLGQRWELLGDGEE